MAALVKILDSSPGLGLEIAGYSWITDGVTPDETAALQSLAQLSQQDGSLGGILAKLGWIIDGITEHER